MAAARIVALPVAVLVAGTAAFALGGAVVGTLLPQLGALGARRPGLTRRTWQTASCRRWL